VHAVAITARTVAAATIAVARAPLFVVRTPSPCLRGCGAIVSWTTTAPVVVPELRTRGPARSVRPQPSHCRGC
jgi:hypothetical protein